MNDTIRLPRLDPGSIAQITPAGEELDRGGDRYARIAWSTIAEPGDITAHHLIEAIGAEAAFNLLLERGHPRYLKDAVNDETGTITVTEDQVQEALDRWLPRLAENNVKRAVDVGVRFGVTALIPSDLNWPQGFADLKQHGPNVLYVRGADAALTDLHSTGVSIVGARAATGYGEHVAVEFASRLVDRGYAIVSGGAYGIDGAAHRATIAAHGTTVAILAGGLDRMYPSGHEALLARIIETGAAVSEVPCGTAPTKWRFLQRNRLIAAAAAATVVVEAGWRSGSLNTAGHAKALRRPLGAVPGPVTSSASSGCHRLLREFDAIAVTNPDEVYELAQGVRPSPRPAVNTLDVDPEGAD